MKINVGPRAEVAIRPEIKTIRPPADYIDILSKDESEFRKYINEIESNPIFQNMISKGVVKKVGFKGRIPSHIYQEFRDREFMDFLNKYGITEKADWESDFFDKQSLRNVQKMLKKYGVPRGDLIKALDYCRHLQLSWHGKEEEDFTSFISLDDNERFGQMEDVEALADTDESVAELAQLLEDNGISEQDFVEYFLSGNIEPFDIAKELDLDLDTLEEIIDLVDRVNIINSMQVNVVNKQQTAQKKDTNPIAAIKRLSNPPRAEIQMDSDEEYGYRYNIDKKTDSINDNEQSLIDRLNMINQRRSLTFRMVQFIFNYQYMYFVSMNPCHLKPLCQAEIAREMGEHESTISRILRHKYIEAENGVSPLPFFCQSKGEIIERIIQIREKEAINSGERDNPFSDAEIAEILDHEYKTKVSRRTVTYYRNKLDQSPKFYKRKKIIKQKE